MVDIYWYLCKEFNYRIIMSAYTSKLMPQEPTIWIIQCFNDLFNNPRTILILFIIDALNCCFST